MNNSLKIIVSAIVLVSLTACSKGYKTRGYLFDKGLADEIMAGVDNKQSVQATLGNPTVMAAFDDKTWYYISTNVKIKPLRHPIPVFRRVMAVSFNDKGVVENVKNYDLSAARTINPVTDKTPTRGKDLNFFQQLFINVGRSSGQRPAGPVGPGPNGS